MPLKAGYPSLFSLERHPGLTSVPVGAQYALISSSSPPTSLAQSQPVLRLNASHLGSSSSSWMPVFSMPSRHTLTHPPKAVTSTCSKQHSFTPFTSKAVTPFFQYSPPYVFAVTQAICFVFIFYLLYLLSIGGGEQVAHVTVYATA